MTVHFGSPRRQRHWVSPGGGGPVAAYSASFLTALPAEYTLTRTGTNGSYFDVNGILQVAPAANTPRIDYNPTTLAAQGLLIEPAVTNVILRNNLTTTTSFTVLSTTTRTANAFWVPTNLQQGTKLTAGTGAASYGVQVAATIITTVVSSVYTASVYLCWDGAATSRYQYLSISNGSTSYYTVVLDLSNGTVTQATSNGITATNRVISAVNSTVNTSNALGSGGWYRVAITYTAINTAPVMAFGPAGSATPTLAANGFPTFTGTGVEACYPFGPQHEANPFVTSVIINTGAATARGADTVTNSTLTWYNSAAGTAIATFDSLVQTATTQQNIFSIGTTTTLGMAAAIAASSANVIASFDANATTSLGSVTYATQAKVGVAYDGTTNSGALNGGTVVAAATQAAITAPTVLRLGGGANATSFYGHLKAFSYYASRVTNAQLQTLTT